MIAYTKQKQILIMQLETKHMCTIKLVLFYLLVGIPYIFNNQ